MTYTDDEYAARVGWGHSAISDAEGQSVTI